MLRSQSSSRSSPKSGIQRIFFVTSMISRRPPPSSRTCGGGKAREPVKPRDEDAVLIERRDHGQVVPLGEGEVFGAGAGGDVHQPGPFRGGGRLPRGPAVLHAAPRRQIV